VSDSPEATPQIQENNKRLMIGSIMALMDVIAIIIVVGILVFGGYTPMTPIILTEDKIVGIWTLIIAENSEQYQVIFNADGTWLKEQFENKYWEMGTYAYEGDKLVMTRLASIEDTVEATFRYTIISMTNTQITMKNDQSQAIQTLRKSQS